METFVAAMAIHLLAVISPGPDFALVVKQSASIDRSAGIMTALGVSMGVAVQIIASLVGISAVVANDPVMLICVKCAAIVYLGYLGLTSICGALHPVCIADDRQKEASLRKGRALIGGFVNNICNPKALLFYSSFLAAIELSPYAKAALALEMAFASGVCFVLVAVIASSPAIAQFRFATAWQIWGDRAFGGIMLVFAFALANGA